MYVKCWRDTEINDHVTWVYETENPDGIFRERVGTYCAVSADKRRIYTIGDGYVNFRNFYYYPEKIEDDWRLDEEILSMQFVRDCDEVFRNGRVDVYFEDIANGMKAMSEALELGWIMKEFYNNEAYDIVYRFYSIDFAKKAHIGENVIFCFSEESVREVLADNPGATCDFKMQSVIMDYSDGYDEDNAYIIHLPN